MTVHVIFTVGHVKILLVRFLIIIIFNIISIMERISKGNKWLHTSKF